MLSGAVACLRLFPPPSVRFPPGLRSCFLWIQCRTRCRDERTFPMASPSAQTQALPLKWKMEANNDALSHSVNSPKIKTHLYSPWRLSCQPCSSEQLAAFQRMGRLRWTDCHLVTDRRLGAEVDSAGPACTCA